MRAISDIDPLEQGVVSVRLSPGWQVPLPPLVELLDAHFGAGCPSTGLTKPADGVGLAGDLMRAAPALSGLARDAATLLAAGACGLLVPALGLAGLPLEDKRKILYALSALMGTPSVTNPRTGEVVWDVKDARREAAGDAAHHGRYWSFSETNDEASYHTDTQYFADPERYFLLYFHEIASCGGGVNSLRSVEMLKDEMMRSRDGREALAFFHEQPLPFRIPTLFTSTGRPETREYTFAPLFGADVYCRYRSDTLEKGLEDHPEYDTPQARRHLAFWQKLLDDGPGEIRQAMPRDSLVIIDNHRALHARSAFEDHRRLVVRVRFHAAPGRLDMLRG
ncbi:TauD/TfdA family dioxygenase [Xanthobacter sp. V4C-4]|uniref:TauD/TfdA family dioxygenase n=1 Tax=Xanthobacter cornucopiae TaxID=3119924 RepID=UPI00372ADD70